MFAPKMAKAQAKAPDSPTRKLAPQPSTLLTPPLDGGAVEQARMLPGTIGNQATLRYLTQRLSNLPAEEPAGRHEQESARENMTARATSRGPSWDFSKIPLFPPERADQPNAQSVPTAEPSLTLMRPETTRKPPNTRVAKGAQEPWATSGFALWSQHSMDNMWRVGQASPTPSFVVDAIRSPARSLESDDRSTMETKFGSDF